MWGQRKHLQYVTALHVDQVYFLWRLNTVQTKAGLESCRFSKHSYVKRIISLSFSFSHPPPSTGQRLEKTLAWYQQQQLLVFSVGLKFTLKPKQNMQVSLKHISWICRWMKLIFSDPHPIAFSQKHTQIHTHTHAEAATSRARGTGQKKGLRHRLLWRTTAASSWHSNGPGKPFPREGGCQWGEVSPRSARDEEKKWGGQRLTPLSSLRIVQKVVLKKKNCFHWFGGKGQKISWTAVRCHHRMRL